ncbi:hypothetical protein [Reinekea blandensis]|uniref:Uncharacterized protein n=1 Tax=Reinekea blandensis MED297 TaxID=314283 RepID=A4BDT6_9GAMM|nr:hypothetical protein [Reinekea blandensis]EAR09695.1 hypothetical protein MED297_16089 [Reinekea blandensis MED297]
MYPIIEMPITIEEFSNHPNWKKSTSNAFCNWYKEVTLDRIEMLKSYSAININFHSQDMLVELADLLLEFKDTDEFKKKGIDSDDLVILTFDVGCVITQFFIKIFDDLELKPGLGPRNSDIKNLPTLYGFPTGAIYPCITGPINIRDRLFDDEDNSIILKAYQLRSGPIK